MRIFLRYGVAALVVYAVLLSAMFVAMLQPPAVFGRIMSRLPLDKISREFQWPADFG